MKQFKINLFGLMGIIIFSIGVGKLLNKIDSLLLYLMWFALVLSGNLAIVILTSSYEEVKKK